MKPVDTDSVRIYQTACGGAIHFNKETRAHLAVHQNVIEHVGEAITKISLTGKREERLRQEIDLEYVVGRSSLLTTKAIDAHTPTYFARRKGRSGASRVVLNESPKETSIISIVAEPIEEKRYNLLSAWYGKIAPREPWDSTLLTEPKAFEESLDFWCCHALVHEVDYMEDSFESTWQKVINNHNPV